VKGVLWYQGESNDRNPHDYKDLLRQLILYWREQWKQEKLPFVVAQLPGFSIDLKENSDAWPMIRDAQANAALLPEVAVTVNLDLGEWNDLHPLNKKEVARRIALAVRGMIYGEEVVFKGPELRKWEVVGNRVQLFFDAGEGNKMEVKNGIGTEAFQLAGADGIFYPAEGQMEDHEVSVWCKEVERPEFLRYGYENAPEKGLLANQDGLLTSPFCLKLGEGKKMYDWGTHLFDDQWFFFKESLHKMLDEFPPVTGFQPIGLPHDWLIEQGNDLYENSTGWYRKCIYFQPGKDRIALLRFDGVYMDSTIYVNRKKAGEWKYGYSCFEVDMTPWLNDGENEILVKVNHQSPNGRWYSGAGIYRDVWLKVLHRDRMISDGLYVSARKQENECWELEISAEVQALRGGTIRFYLNDREVEEWAEGTFLAECTLKEEQGVQTVTAAVSISQPKQWDIENPFCYELRAELFRNREKLQKERLTIGFRTVEFNPDQGFLLNGRKVKLNGVCEHHDLGCLGAAYHSKAMRRKLTILKEMGVNAVRISHNMPAQDVMELADEMGILIVSEAFDMWERPKNPYDYARFFPEWYQKDVASWVRRDRNHPSLIMWSIGNEIYDTHADERGQEVTRLLMEEVKRHDPRSNARVTIASNYMPWENARKCADLVKLAGYNYGEKYYEGHHKAHPDWIIYGSETASTVQSRGIYHFPYSQSLLADEDEQCSSLGNSTTSWGAKSSEACIIAERDHKFSCGQFLWTGFDYIGEPTPYHTRNSYFGQVDTAGFPKDSYYLYQAEWADYLKMPMVHIFPYWDFNDGQMIDVRISSNAPVVELFLNGKSQGKRAIDHEKGERLTGDYQIPYEEGVLQALAYDESGNVIAEDQKSSFGEPEKICLQGEKDCLKANGEDLLFVTVSVRDAKGNSVENANNRVFITVSGSGALVGLDNGDSTDIDEYKGSSRRLFSGKLLLVVATGTEPGELKITVASPGMKEAVLTVPVLEAKMREGVSSLAYRVSQRVLEQERLEDCFTDIPVRNIKLTSPSGTKLTKDQQTVAVTAKICPENALDQTLIWSVVNDKGIHSKLASLTTRGNQAFLTAKSDGHLRLRCMSKSGTEKVRILSTLEFSVEGIGETFLDPYEFISAGLYDYSAGEVGNGNEKGVSTARDGETQVGFHNLNFGSSGSDEITIPVFALTGEPYRIRIYEGMPGEEQAELIADEIYQKPSIWNVYQDETFHLTKKLRGVTSLCMVLEKKVHIKGFSFVRKSRGYDRLAAAECDEVYGDHFKKEQEEIREIGNNVTIQFRDMEFGDKGADGIRIWGYTRNNTNSILVRFLGADGEDEQEQMLEFKHSNAIHDQVFSLNPVTGTKTVEFVFLPGSHFDFRWFQFINSGERNRNM
jgi:beta-galactosidase